MDSDLIDGPYRAPAVRVGAWIEDWRFGLVEVGGWTHAPIVWPRRKKRGAHSPILCGDLVRAVCTESVVAICHHWGVSAGTVWAWRCALGVKTSEGSRRIARRGVPADAAARGRERAATPQSRAKSAEAKRGKPVSPGVRARLLRYARAPKPADFGERANRWMLAAKSKRPP